MNAAWIITAFIVLDTLMEPLGHQSDVRAHVPDSEVILIAVVAAKYFQNHHERTLCVLHEARYLSGQLDLTRFNRRLHQLADWLAFLATTLGAVCIQGDVFVIDSMPLPVCRRIHAIAGRTMNGNSAALAPPNVKSASAAGVAGVSRYDRDRQQPVRTDRAGTLICPREHRL